MDIRLKNLSYSSLLELHKCPRSYFLSKCSSSPREDDPLSYETLTFAFGHAVGTGVQDLLLGTPPATVIWNTFKSWYADLALVNPKQKKSFYHAVAALQKFDCVAKAGLSQYEVLLYEGKPATELSFCVEFPDGFKFRGFVDAVLKHKVTGEILVLEVKTTSSAALNAAQYKNSAQGLGYSVVLDVIAPETSSYQVLYMPYKTKSMEFELFSFPKTYHQRALWIQEVLLDIETIKLYDQTGVYPMRGESCFSFYRECDYYNTCTLSDKFLVSSLSPEQEKLLEEKESQYQIRLTMSDLIEAQIAKNSLPTAASSQQDFPSELSAAFDDLIL